MADAEVVTFTGAHGPPVDLVRDVYAEVYADPPYCDGPAEVEAFAESWPARVAAPGFRLALARDEGRTVAFTFGHLLRVETQWWSGALAPLDVDTEEWPGRTFAVIELAVREPYRRRHVAERMHAALLAGVDAERVTLLVRPELEAAPARAAYAKWGYRRVGQLRPGEGRPVFDVMVADPLPA